MRCPPSESRVTHTCCLAVLTGAPTTPVTSPVVPAGPGLSPLQGAECVPFLVRPWPILGFSHWQWQRQLPWKEQEAGQADAAIAVRQEPFQGPGEPWTGQGSGDHAASQPLAEISPRVCENWLPTPWDAAQNTNVFPHLGRGVVVPNTAASPGRQWKSLGSVLRALLFSTWSEQVEKRYQEQSWSPDILFMAEKTRLEGGTGLTARVDGWGPRRRWSVGSGSPGVRPLEVRQTISSPPNSMAAQVSPLPPGLEWIRLKGPLLHPREGEIF